MKRPTSPAASVVTTALLLVAFPASSAVISFTGQLDFVDLDAGGAIYSGVPIGTSFSGAIDDQTFNGFITDGTTRTDFGCCIAAGGIEVTNDQVLDQDSVDRLNTWKGPGFFSVGESVDLVDVEGDVETTAGGRIEIGLTYVLDPSAFDDDSVNNYPFDPADLLLTLFFIFEEDGMTDEVYSAIGDAQVVPLPAAGWFMLTALAATLGRVRRRRTSGAGSKFRSFGVS